MRLVTERSRDFYRSQVRFRYDKQGRLATLDDVGYNVADLYISNQAVVHDQSYWLIGGWIAFLDITF